jgi:hypothetical protein
MIKGVLKITNRIAFYEWMGGSVPPPSPPPAAAPKAALPDIGSGSGMNNQNNFSESLEKNLLG